MIIRMYEGYGRKHKVKGKVFAQISRCPKKVLVCDLLEKEISEEIIFDKNNKLISFEIEPFEIKTIRLVTGN